MAPAIFQAAALALRASSIVCPTTPTCPQDDKCLYTANSVSLQVSCSTDFLGGDLQLAQASTLATCMRVCATTTNCVAVSYVNRNCYLKSTLNPPQANANVIGAAVAARESVAPVPSATSSASPVSPSTCPAAYTCPENDGCKIQGANSRTFALSCDTDYYGGDFANMGVASLEACTQACAANSQCLAASFVGGKGAGTCYLKSTKNGANSNDNVNAVYVVTTSTIPSLSVTSSASVSAASSSIASSSSVSESDSSTVVLSSSASPPSVSSSASSTMVSTSIASSSSVSPSTTSSTMSSSTLVSSFTSTSSSTITTLIDPGTPTSSTSSSTSSAPMCSSTLAFAAPPGSTCFTVTGRSNAAAIDGKKLSVAQGYTSPLFEYAGFTVATFTIDSNGNLAIVSKANNGQIMMTSREDRYMETFPNTEANSGKSKAVCTLDDVTKTLNCCLAGVCTLYANPTTSGIHLKVGSFLSSGTRNVPIRMEYDVVSCCI